MKPSNRNASTPCKNFGRHLRIRMREAFDADVPLFRSSGKSAHDKGNTHIFELACRRPSGCQTLCRGGSCIPLLVETSSDHSRGLDDVDRRLPRTRPETDQRENILSPCCEGAGASKEQVPHRTTREKPRRSETNTMSDHQSPILHSFLRRTMMAKSMQWPYHGVAKSLCLPGESPLRSEGLVRDLRLALTTPDERKREVERMVAEKVSECLTSMLRPTTRLVWLHLKAEVAFQGLRIEDFLSDRTFYRRVAKERARMNHARREAMLRRIVMKHLMTSLWPEHT
ncbi:hypothetical protein HJB88_12165 [Rhizobium sp. NZLR5]|uniref:hypothetical protein n=1 Tax=unclassified Rhizobium TaxID=2613769 RepID=UPI001C83380B|nr:MULTISPECIES: hypothetical protein [unclassified Rhizobium]MBX5183391.1 hypothetical protein [Rhizobium sp. NZLR5]MBX5198324.1 hypothetical protein [Rhizobium sp. NZLR10]